MIRALGRENKQCYGLKASVTVILDRPSLINFSFCRAMAICQILFWDNVKYTHIRYYFEILCAFAEESGVLGVGEYCFVVVTNKKGKKVPWFKFVNVTTPFVCSYTFFKCSNQKLGKGTTQYSLLISYHW